MGATWWSASRRTTSELVLDAYDGSVLWQGEPGERLVSVDDFTALVKSADSRTLYAAELRDGVQWERGVNEGVQAALARYAAIVLDERPDRLIVVNQSSGAVLRDVRSSAEVLAVGPRGVVIGDGRDIAYVPFAGTTPVDPIVPADPGTAPDRTPARCAAAPNRSPATPVRRWSRDCRSASPVDGAGHHAGFWSARRAA